MKNKTSPSIFLILIFFCHFSLYGNQVPDADLLRAGSRWLQLSGLLPDRQLAALPGGMQQLRSNFSQGSLILLPLQPSGYLVLSTDNRLPPVIGFSEASLSAKHFSSQHPFYALLQVQDEKFGAAISQPATRGLNDAFAANQLLWQQLLETTPTRAGSTTPPPGSIVQQPLLSTIWDQDYPFNHYAPPGPNTIHERAPVGCVPLSIAQLLNFHQWPYRGQGSSSNHNDAEEDLHVQLAAAFGRPFAWGSFPDSLVSFGEPTPTPTLKLLAQACNAFAAFLGSNFELYGTSTPSGGISGLLANNLFFQSTIFKMSDINPIYSNYIDQATLYANVKTDIEAGLPAYVGFDHPYMGGHSFIADGLALFAEQNYFHLNYGWGGRENGWYLLDSGYHGPVPGMHSVITNGITNIRPQFMAQFLETPYEQTTELTLHWQFPPYHANEVTAFRLQATRNGQTTILSNDIPPEARSWPLTEQPEGAVKYTLTARKAGSWQGSDTIHLLIATTPQERIVQLHPANSTQPVTIPFVLNLTVPDLPGINLVAKTNRPDIYPDQNCVISGEGTNRTLTLTAARDDRAGHVLVWVTASKDSWQTQATADLTVLYPEVPITGAGTAVGSPQQPFFNDGHVNWKVQSDTYFTRPQALQVDNRDMDGFLALTEFARLYTYVTGPCRLTFQWQTQSQSQAPAYPDSGHLIFTVNDNEVQRISGNSGWKKITFTIEEPGLHTLSWTLQWTFLQQNGSYTYNRNQAWLDDFSVQQLYQVSVIGGLASTSLAGPAEDILAAEGEKVTLVARPPTPHPDCNFERWEADPPVPLANYLSSTTTFTMPSQAVLARSCFLRAVAYSLNAGWNLISLPITPTPSYTAELDGLIAISCHLPNGKLQYTKATAFPGGQAYWLFNKQIQPVDLELMGNLAPLRQPPTTAGWHLFAPVEELPIPNNTLAWKWNQKTYELVENETMSPPNAYWLQVEE